MSERGVFAVDRGIWDHPLLNSREPFTRREAWLWLISEASWKPRRRRVGSSSVEIGRGEIAHSIRFIAEAWGWPKSNVARFLDALKTDTMIETRTDHGVTVITICKYDEYQRVSLPERDTNGTACGTELGQQRDKLEDNKNIKLDIGHSAASEPVQSATAKPSAKPKRKPNTEGFDQWWSIYPLKKAKAFASKSYDRIIRDGIATEVELLNGARRYAAECAGKEARFIKHPATWLNGGCWADELPTSINLILPSAATDWDQKLRGYVAMPVYSRSWYGPGSPPGEPGCEAPAVIQRKYGFEPALPKAIGE
jgi:hypothetical protein